MTELIQNFYNRLSNTGYTKPYLKKYIFPDWWEDKAALNPSAFYELKLIVARRLGLDLKSILDAKKPIEFSNAGPCHFKNGNNIHDKKNTQNLSRMLAEMAAAAMSIEYQGLPNSGSQIRNEILSQSKPWVGFAELLDYLWINGVPVLFLANIHPKWRKMEGMVTVVDNRPVITLSKNTHSCAWQLFILAHEVGHIIKGHLQNYTTFADDKINKNDQDPVEQEANHAAIELLTDDGDTTFVSSSGSWLSSDELATQSIHYGREHKIDPGHIALNYGYAINQINTSNAALKIIEPNSNAPAMIVRKMIEFLDEDLLPEDSYLYLLNMCTEKA